MREAEHYRENLSVIIEKFGKPMIPLMEAAEWLDLDTRTVKKHYKTEKVGGRYYVKASTLAKEI